MLEYGDGSSFCRVCHVEFPSIQLEDHFQTRVHKTSKSLLVQETLFHEFCEICHIEVKKSNLGAHQAGDSHLKKSKHVAVCLKHCMSCSFVLMRIVVWKHCCIMEALLDVEGGSMLC